MYNELIDHKILILNFNFADFDINWDLKEIKYYHIVAEVVKSETFLCIACANIKALKLKD